MDSLKRQCRDLDQNAFFGAYPVPIDWYPQSDGALFPLPADHRWESLESLGRELGITGGILCTLPLIWQLEPLAHKAARALSVPIAVTVPQNLPPVLPYSENAGIDLVVAAPECIPQLVPLLERSARPPKAIVVVHRGAQTIRAIETPFLTVHELHLVPGMVLGYQTAQLARENGRSIGFKLSDACAWNIREDGSASISAKEHATVPFRDLALPYRFVQESGTGIFQIHP